MRKTANETGQCFFERSFLLAKHSLRHHGLDEALNRNLAFPVGRRESAQTKQNFRNQTKPEDGSHPVPDSLQPSSCQYFALLQG